MKYFPNQDEERNRPVWSNIAAGKSILLVLICTLLVKNAAGEDDKLKLQLDPAGWIGVNSSEYKAAGDCTQPLDSKKAGWIQSKYPQPLSFAVLKQKIKADCYRGKRVRLSAFVKTENVENRAGLWMRVDGPDNQSLLDNMENRAIKGTTEWGKCEIVLDIPEKSIGIALGGLLEGKGQIWIAALKLEEVKKDIAITIDKINTENFNEQEEEHVINRDEHIGNIMDESIRRGERYVKPVRVRITHSISVASDATPPDEIIRCWIPFPRDIPGRQTHIAIVKTEPETYRLAPAQDLQRVIYFEKTAQRGVPAYFAVEYECEINGVYVDVDPDKVKCVDPEGPLKPCLQEEPPHIVFTDELKALSRRVIRKEQNPYRIAQKLFEWVVNNITWTSVDYRGISNLSMDAFSNRRGDCGMMAMLFITLSRMNGIPAQWQSGWQIKPPGGNPHDWNSIYLEPYGWMPMDVNCGLIKTSDPKLKWFYLNGVDSYRLVFNDAISRQFTPSKKFARSEPVDSQLGEVEWQGGNLDFDQWDYDMKWKILKDYSD